MARDSAGTAALYTPELLRLATELADYPLAGKWNATGEARSATCGSSVQLGCEQADNGTVAHVGLQVHACAIGQAAAAIFARHAKERSGSDIERTLRQVRIWLAGEGARPDWPQLDLLEPARDYPARHGAILLPWMAASRALSLAEPAS